MTHFRPTLISSARVHACLYPKCHSRPKIEKNYCNLGFKGFKVLEFGFGLDQLTYTRPSLKSKLKHRLFYTQLTTVGQKLAKVAII